jgi:hypothetical protein
MNKFFYWFNYYSFLISMFVLITLIGRALPHNVYPFVVYPLCFLLGFNYRRYIWPRIEKILFVFDRKDK